ncbi:MAG: hypothetical protein ACTH5V_01670 [Serratia proteamaculans]
MTTIHTIFMVRPADNEMELLWKLYHAAQRVEDRWCQNTVGPIADELANTDLSRKEKLFLLRAWQVLVDGSGGFSRLMGAFDTYVHNMQNPAVDYVAYKPSLQQLFADAELLPVVMEAYTEAMTELERKEEQRHNWYLMAEKISDEMDSANKRIAELETIATDYAGKFQKAQDAAKHLVIMNDSDKAEIAHLEEQLATPVQLPKRWDVSGQVNPPRIVQVQFEQQNRTLDQCADAVRAAGFTVGNGQ